MKIFYKLVFSILISLLSGIIPVQSQILDEVPVNEWDYFKIYDRAEDNATFVLLQQEMEIDPILESYIIVVNISDPNPQNQYLVLGDEADPSAQRFAWSQLSETVRRGLLNWSGENKVSLY